MDTITSPGVVPAPTTWPVAGLLLDALARRDFDAMTPLLADDVRFRALVPRGPFELNTAAEAVARFRAWFGGDDEFEVLDASVGQVGERLHACWRIRLHPSGSPETGRTAEQHVFTTGTDRITALDLLCSGFQADAR